MASGRSTKAQFTFRCTHENKTKIEEGFQHYQERHGLDDLSMNLVKERAVLEWAKEEVEVKHEVH